MNEFNEIISENHNYKKLEILMKDQIKQVSIAEKKNDKLRVIIKEINLLKLNKQEKEMASKEAIILSNLKHPNIVNCFDFFLEKEIAYIIMEYVEGGDLLNKIQEQKNKNIPFEEKIIINWFIEICEGLEYIHGKNIIIRDLKPQKIFITKDNHIKLGEFGIDKILDTKYQTYNKIVNPAYLSPEIIEDKPFDYKSDIWNLGIILYELTQLKHPFINDEIGLIKGMNNIKEGIYFEFTNKNYSKELLDLITNLLKINPNERLSINKIIVKCNLINRKNSKNE
jgi:NIMA (never in mitosis gene a)-related kinase